MVGDLVFIAAQDGEPVMGYDWEVDRQAYIRLLGEYDMTRKPTALETGGHHPNMVEHHHDMYLDSGGRTYEEAVIQLARNVAIRFNDDGSDSGRTPSNPRADELNEMLSQRMAELDDSE